MMHPLIEHHREEIEALCRRFGVRRLELFGSLAERGDVPAAGDADFLVEFDEPPSGRTLATFFGLKEALEAELGRPVDLVMTGAVRNPYVRASIERTRALVYAA